MKKLVLFILFILLVRCDNHIEEESTIMENKKEAEMRALIWDEYKKSQDDILEHREIHYNGYTMRFAYFIIGEAYENGYPLFIALHGGGNTTAEINEGQFEHMQIYYKDSIENGIYLTVRSITDSRADIHAAPESFVMYDKLIENFILHRNVDPNRVYLMGFSAGAEYAIAPRFADRLAAVALSAGHHGWHSPVNLMNLPFLGQVGENDIAFNRHHENIIFGMRLQELQDQFPNKYIYQIFVHRNKGHQIIDNSHQRHLQSVHADNIAWMNEAADTANWINTNSVDFLTQFVRDPLPKEMVWDLSSRAEMRNIQSFYWLSACMSMTSGKILASYDTADNRVVISTTDIKDPFYVMLNSDMVNFDRPLVLVVNESETTHILEPCYDTIKATTWERGDINFQFSAKIKITNP